MKRTLTPIAPLLLVILAGCAADGTAIGDSATPTPATPVVATTPIPASTPTPVAPAFDPTRGQIVLIEPIKSVNKQGGSAMLAIGASVLGAFIPGPWGGVAAVTTGQAGQYALNNATANAARYHVRMADGTIQTITQNTLSTLAVGTSVQILTLADGSKRLVQAVPAASPTPVTSTL